MEANVGIPEYQKETIKRAVIAYEMRQEGSTFSEIGKFLGLSTPRAQQLVRKGEIFNAEGVPEMSTRLKNVLIKAGLSEPFCPDEVVQKFPTQPHFMCSKNAGRKTLKELQVWLFAQNTELPLEWCL